MSSHIDVCGFNMISTLIIVLLFYYYPIYLLFTESMDIDIYIFPILEDYF